jgi:hypothetical protein
MVTTGPQASQTIICSADRVGSVASTTSITY